MVLTGLLLILVLERQKVFGLENLSGGEIFREVFFFYSTAFGYRFGKEPGLRFNSNVVYWETLFLGLLVFIEQGIFKNIVRNGQTTYREADDNMKPRTREVMTLSPS